VCPAGLTNIVAPGSLFGAYQAVPVNQTYNDVLPSANLRWEFDKELIGRLAAAETMTRPDYSALAGTTNLTPPGNVLCPPPADALCHGTGSASNQYLKPIRSYNYDAGLEWYFAPRSLLAATLFYMDLKNYVGYGNTTRNFLNFGPGLPANGLEQPYDITIPVNVKGRVQGVEFAYQQAFGNYFGIDANYTYADGKQTEGVPPNGDTRLVGTSKSTYNIGGYFENAHFSARISYNYRSAFYSGLDRSTAFSQDSIGTLAASLAWYVNDNWSLNLDGQNLNDPTLKYYALNTTQPRAFYRNGRQYYLTVHAKF
jgi:iron complex outermembrane receptor protein